jgi:hypothetical protein
MIPRDRAILRNEKSRSTIVWVVWHSSTFVRCPIQYISQSFSLLMRQKFRKINKNNF